MLYKESFSTKGYTKYNMIFGTIETPRYGCLSSEVADNVPNSLYIPSTSNHSLTLGATTDTLIKEWACHASLLQKND